MAPHIQSFFTNLLGRPDRDLINAIKKIKTEIQGENIKNRVSPEVYIFPLQRLLSLQAEQRRIFMLVETSILDDTQLQTMVSGLQKHFEAECQRNRHQWPTAWVEFLIGPLRQQLRNLDVHLKNDNDDIEMGGLCNNEGCEEQFGDGQNIGGQLQPGFTKSGDCILGYIPTYSRGKGQKLLSSAKVFVKVDDINPICILTMREAGISAIKAYHQLPESQKNNIIDNARRYYGDMDELEFVSIIGIAWVRGPSGSDRKPPTYIWIETQTHSNKPVIVNRTNFTNWLGTGPGNRHIDKWFEDHNIDPEWWLPSDRLLTYSTAEQSSKDSKPNTQTRRNQPTSSTGDGQIETLKEAFNQMALEFQKVTEEAQKDRKEYQEMVDRAIERLML
ncbi:hypothetical protein F4803DRAFT_160951 [Xylaria telfairii]|nr:hypothetical protein F4803DRAFT_160951 [Xylaria telfairii]